MAKLPKLTRGIYGAPIRHGPEPPQYWLPPPQSTDGCVRFIIRLTPNRLPQFYDQDELASAVAVVLDEDVYQELRPQRIIPIPQSVTNDEDGVPLGGLRLDEDYWLFPGFLRLEANRAAFLDTDDAAPLGGLRIDEEYWLDPGRIPIIRNAQPILDTDESAPLGGFRFEEDDWRHSQLIRLLQNTQPWSVDDDLGIPPSAAIDEDTWEKPWQQILPSSRQVILDAEDYEPLGGFRLEEDDQRASQLIRLVPNVQPILTDEDLGIPPTTAIDEDPWTRPFQQSLPSSRQLWADNDDAAPLGGFRLDEEYWVYPGVPTPLVNRQPWLEGDERVAPPVLFGLDEDYWAEPWISRYRVNPQAAAAIREDNDAWVLFVAALLGTSLRVRLHVAPGIAPVVHAASTVAQQSRCSSGLNCTIAAASTVKALGHMAPNISIGQ